MELKSTDDVMQLVRPNKDINEEKIAIMEVQLKDHLDKMEQCAEEGKISEAQELDQQVERIKKEIHMLREDVNPLFKQEKQMEVCQICGSFLIVDSAGGHRADFHFEGKQHIGYAILREQVKTLTEKYSRRGAYYDRARPQQYRNRSRSRSPRRHASSYGRRHA